MKRHHIFICIILPLFLSCAKEKVAVSNVIYDLKLSKHTIFADGSSKVIITVKLNVNAAAANRGVIFQTSTGNFQNGSNNAITVQASFDKDSLIAKATFIAPLKSGKVYISVLPSIANKKDYTLYDSITVKTSMPASIKLNPSSFGLISNYMSNDTINGLLSNSLGNNVSLGNQVVFEDYFPNQSPANGQFRNIVNKSDMNSSVSAIYSIGVVPIGSIIYVKSTVLDSTGKKTNIKDSVKLTITN